MKTETTTDKVESGAVTRSIAAPDGTRWVAFADDAIVAHGRPGAVLAFRAEAGDEDQVLRSTITFNSMSAADFALRTIADKELVRRLSLARRAAGGI